MKYIMILVTDLVIAALITGGIWGVNYVIPQQGIQAVPLAPAGTQIPKK